MTEKSDHLRQPIIAGHAVANHGTGQASTTSAPSSGSVGSAILLHLAVCHQEGSEMPEVVCRHYERIVPTDDGHIGCCRYCGQEKVYTSHGQLKVIKRGKLGGQFTMVNPPKLKPPTEVI